MSQAVQQFGQDLQTSILPEQREDEIGLLARSFRQMQNQIQTQLAELNQRRHDLEYLARHDTLTGLPNRRLFGERLEQALAQARRRRQGFALIFVDLDRFKDINDNLGHEAGDAVLQTVALRLKNDTREVDTVARLGGDEFVVLLDTYTNRHQLVTVAEKLLETLSQPMDVLGRQLTVGASMGISQYPLDGLSANELLARADQAMYATKAAGRNGYRFFSDESDENQQLSIAEIP
jgi:diguanylate cyclase (GGDEF)-like protein